MCHSYRNIPEHSIAMHKFCQTVCISLEQTLLLILC